jgi:hypothetical protein
MIEGAVNYFFEICDGEIDESQTTPSYSSSSAMNALSD